MSTPIYVSQVEMVHMKVGLKSTIMELGVQSVMTVLVQMMLQ